MIEHEKLPLLGTERTMSFFAGMSKDEFVGSYMSEVTGAGTFVRRPNVEELMERHALESVHPRPPGREGLTGSPRCPEICAPLLRQEGGTQENNDGARAVEWRRPH